MQHGELQHDQAQHDQAQHDQSQHSNMQPGKLLRGEHGHVPVDASSWAQPPSMTLVASKDAMSGWNLHIETQHFKFAPEHVNREPVRGEGHAHLYINGEKTARLYAPWFHIDNLSPGLHVITVTLNANNHGHLLLNGKPVAATIELHQQ